MYIYLYYKNGQKWRKSRNLVPAQFNTFKVCLPKYSPWTS